MEEQQVKNIIEAGLLVAGRPLSISQLHALFQDDKNAPDKAAIRAAIAHLKEDYEDRGIELVEVSSGFRMQSRQEMAPWMAHLFQEKAPRYSRALLETLVLIAYKQPITRAEIEQVRGVAVSSNIVRTLQERNWVNVVGHKDLPGKPALLGTTRQFLDYFNLKRLDDLPPLGEIKDIDQIDSFAAEEAALVEQGLIKAPDENDESVSEDDATIAGAAIAVSGVDIALTDDEEPLESAGKVIDVELEDAEANDEINADAEQLELEASDEVDTEAEQLEASDESDADAQQSEVGEEAVVDAELEIAEATDITPESQLKQVLQDFASEHQQQVDVQREIEERNLSKPVGPAADNDGDDQPTASASNEIADEEISEADESEELALEEVLDASLNIQQGDMPKPGDTLH